MSFSLSSAMAIIQRIMYMQSAETLGGMMKQFILSVQHFENL